MTSLVIPLTWPSADLSPNARVHPLARHRAAKKAKEEAWGWTVAAMSPLGIRRGTWGGPIKVQYVFHPLQDRGRDDDNFTARMKAARDGIALALGVDDKHFALQHVIWGDRRDGTVDVILTPATVEIQHKGTIE